VDQFWVALAAGIIAALIATGIWALALAQLRPKIAISPHIAVAEEDGKMVYRVKIINRGRRTIEVLAARNVKGGQVEVRKAVTMRTNTLNQLPGRRRKDRDYKYAFRFGTNENLATLWDDSKTERVVFRVFAQDALSRVGRAFERIYYSKTADLKQGVFDLGDCFDVTPHVTGPSVGHNPPPDPGPTREKELTESDPSSTWPWQKSPSN
jgi:hypothetical protein